MPYFCYTMKKETTKKEKYKELITYAIIIILIILIRTFIITPVRVNGTSMDDTLKDKEIMLLNKFSYYFKDIKRFDIIVIDYENTKLIKRVIGLPGETLEYKNNKLYINGKEQKETFLNQETEDFNIEDLGYTKIPENCYFAIGDNRKDSLDSRVFGCFKKDQIKGKANIVLFPLKNFGYKH